MNHSSWYPRALRLITGGIGTVLIGCSGDTANNPTSPPASQTFWALQLNWHAVNLALAAPYDTVQLTASAISATGTPLAEAGRVHYTSSDSTVTVDSTGLVTARYLTSQKLIIASLTIQGVTLTDTAYVQVTPLPIAQLSGFSIQPMPDGIDSAKIALDRGGEVIPVYATIATGDAATDTVCNVNACSLLLDFRSSNPDVATIDQFGNLATVRPGSVTLYASTLAYGVAKRDSLSFVVGYPVAIGTYRNRIYSIFKTGAGGQGLSVTFVPDTLIIGVGGQALFWNNSDTPIDVAFDDSVAILNANVHIADSVDAVSSTGNVSNWATFPVPGTYTYHSPTYGASGTIIVR